MYELRSLWFSITRSGAASLLVLVLTFSALPVLARAADGGSPLADGVLNTDSGVSPPDADASAAEDDDEDIDEWENDILKSATSPSATEWIHELLAGWLHSAGWWLGFESHSDAASK